MAVRDNLKKYIRLAVIIAATAFIGIGLGKLVGSYELRFMLNRTYCGNYRGIEVYKSGTINEENFLGHVYMLRDAPEELTECCDTMYFTGSDLPIPEGGSEEHPTALGLTQNKTVYISTDSYYPEVVFHELFHAYDHCHGYPSEHDSAFNEAYKAEGGKILILAGVEGTHAAEFYATAGALYLLSPGELKHKAPLTYRYFDSLGIRTDVKITFVTE